MKILENKKGQQVFVGIMVFLVVFITVMQFIQPMKDFITTARNPSNLDCGNSSITTGVKMSCVITDIQFPYFIGMALAAGAFILTRQKTLNQ